MKEKISVETILCIPRSINYYLITINNSEPTTIKYLELLPYLSDYLKKKEKTKVLNDLIKSYSSFLFIISKQEFIELEQNKENSKSKIHEHLLNQSLKKELKKNEIKQKNNVIDSIWNKINKSNP